MPMAIRNAGAGRPLGMSQASRRSAMNSRLGSGIGRGEIDWAFEIFALDEEFDGAGEVGLVNPGNILAAVALRSAKASTDQI